MSSPQAAHARANTTRPLHPESQMMGYGYRPELSEGALKCPIFMTSTFVFRTAEEGKAFFELAYGLRKSRPDEQIGLIYSRLNNPDLEILEDRLTLWDGAEEAAVFESGMAAISTTLLQVAGPGDVIIHTEPVYGGTDYLLKHILPRFHIRTVGVPARGAAQAIAEHLRDRAIAEHLAAIYVETPANPTNALVDIAACAQLAAQATQFTQPHRRPLVIVDNTFLGPLWQQPLHHGADLVLYSATKYIGGHSDVIAGVCLGAKALIAPIKNMRTILGTMCSPMTGWMLLRSLETLKVRMTAQMKNARHVADYLADHPKVQQLYYLGHLTPETGVEETGDTKAGDTEAGDTQAGDTQAGDTQAGDTQAGDYAIFHRQCLAAGSMIAFDVVGGEAEAFRFLNALKLFRLAVSLGGTESLAEHPASMTHSDVDPEERIEMGIGEGMVRLSIGVEHPDDLIADLEQAFAAM